MSSLLNWLSGSHISTPGADPEKCSPEKPTQVSECIMLTAWPMTEGSAPLDVRHMSSGDLFKTTGKQSGSSLGA